MKFKDIKLAIKACVYRSMKERWEHEKRVRMQWVELGLVQEEEEKMKNKFDKKKRIIGESIFSGIFSAE